MPDLQTIRQDALLQARVGQRLKELAETDKPGTKIKSLRGGNVEVIVPNKIKWPHEYVLSGSAKERVQYDHLSITQLVAGFCRIMREELNLETRQNMLDYMIALMLLMLTIFPTMRQKPAMPSYFVGWSKGKLKIMGRLPKLTGCEGLMLRDI